MPGLLITKRLTAEEPQTSITMWLLVLLTPVNFLFSAQAGFEWPTGNILWLILAGGVIMYFAQHFLTLSYAAADAAFVQPFDDLKLFSNIAVSWLVLGFAPEGSYWLGIVLIAGASSYLLWSERNGRFGAAQPAIFAAPASVVPDFEPYCPTIWILSCVVGAGHPELPVSDLRCADACSR